MARLLRRMALLIPLVSLAVLPSAAPVEAAAPRLIMVYGPPLARPVVLPDWSENHEFMPAITDDAGIRAEDLDGRPYFDLALFWGSGWERHVEEGKPLEELRPETEPHQAGRLYPAFGDAGPVVALNRVQGATAPAAGETWRRVEAKGLAILARYGIPTRLDPGAIEAPGSIVGAAVPSSLPRAEHGPTAWLLEVPGRGAVVVAIAIAAAVLGMGRLARRRA